MLNIIVAGTNFYGLPGVITYYQKGFIVKSVITASAIFFSTIYHLVEKNKHNMPGIGYFQDDGSQIVLHVLDRTGAILSVLIGLHHIYIKNIPILPLIGWGFIGTIAEIIPEIISGLYSSGRHDSIISTWIVNWLNPTKYKINKHIEHTIYTIGHCIWHLSMFHISNIISRY